MEKKFGFLILGLILLVCCKNPDGNKSTAMQTGRDYPSYGGNKAGNRYSPLNQVNTGNVKNLQVAWTYFANDKPDSNQQNVRSREIQCQPIVVNGILYGTSAELNLFALKAATGQQLWKFEPLKDKQKFNTSRGVVYWEDGDDKRILYSAGAFLYAVNAQTGKLITTFGDTGRVDLHKGLSTPGLNHDINILSVTSTSPGVIYKNTIIMGSSVSEGGDAAPGHVRGFDVVTGKLKWVFHTIPQPGEFGYDTWPKDAYKKIGGANNWSGLVVDEKRGDVIFGTGSPSSDFYGGEREGSNLFSDCVMSLDAETGKMNWYFQTTHHDLWDRDQPCPPNLATVKHNGKLVDVVVQATKDGLVYVLDRDKGTSLFPVEERPVPTNGLPGEHPYPTQKFPLKPKPFAHQIFTEADITDISPEAHDFVKKRFLEIPQPNNKYIPPNTVGTFAFGYSGGAEWGGNAVDPEGILYQNANDQPWDLIMTDVEALNKQMAKLSHGNALYLQNCAGCHGEDRKGSGNVFPNLLNISSRRSYDQIDAIIKTGSGRMPSFARLQDDDRKSIINYLLDKEIKPVRNAGGEHSVDIPTAQEKKQDFPYIPKYINKVWKPVKDQDGYPGIKPPWGTLNAINLNTGDYVWRVPLGEFPELTKKGIPLTGTESYGGPCVTGGDLVFIAGTRDEKIRAFDKKTGKEVWQYQLPAGGYATPITYEADGKQYIAIAAGGARGSKPGGWYVAFALK